VLAAVTQIRYGQAALLRTRGQLHELLELVHVVEDLTALDFGNHLHLYHPSLV